MWMWTLSLVLIFFGIRELTRNSDQLYEVFRIGKERQNLQAVSLVLREIQESIESGAIPTEQSWDALGKLSSPWGTLARDSLIELRKSGSSILPTLRRLSQLAGRCEKQLMSSRARAFQAIAQAGVCGGLVPILGAILYWILPGVRESFGLWVSFCLCFMGTASVGVIWMLSLADSARWGGLSPERRHWVLWTQVAIERFLALLRSGHPPDIAWAETTTALQKHIPDLKDSWAVSVWEEGGSPWKRRSLSAMEKGMHEFGQSVRKTIQVSLLEGTACGERIERLAQAQSLELQTRVDQGLQVLPTQVLKPLFILVAPSVFGVMASAMYLTWLTL